MEGILGVTGWFMSEFGAGITETRKNQHALVGLGSAALAAAVALSG